MVRRTTGPVAVPTTMPRSGARWWVRVSTVGVTAAALVGVYVVPAGSASAAAGDGLSEADRAAAAAAAAPPSDTSSDQNGDDGGNWFTDLFGGGDDEPEGDPIPADAPLAPEQHPVDAPVATPGDPGERVRELTGKRTVNTRTFLLDDGQRQVELSAEPLFYETAHDGLAEIDTTVAATGKAVAGAEAKGLSTKAGKAATSDGWSHASVANTARAYFGQRPDRVVRVEDAAGRGVTVGLPDAAAGDLTSPRVDGDTVTHSEVAGLGGADLSYEVLPGRVKESIVLAEAPDGADPAEFTFTLSELGDLTPRVEDDGSIGFYSELDPEPVASIPAGVMWDSREAETTQDGKLSAPDDQGAAVSTDVDYELERAGKGAWTLTVTPDQEWLGDEARVWPVTVDPTIIVSPTGAFSKDTMILSEAPTTSYYTSSRLSVGRTEGGVARSMVQFPKLTGTTGTDGVVPLGANVTHADLQLYFDQAHTDWATRVPLEVREVTAPWTSSSTTWNSANGLMGAVAGTRRTLNNVSPYASSTGNWPASATGADGFGGDYQFNRDTVAGDIFTWTPDLPASGLWQVWLHNVTGSNRSTQVPVRITHATANPVHTYMVNQQAATGWSEVAAHTFDAGTSGKVEILDTPATSTTAVIADGVRFIKDATEVRTAGEIGKWHTYDVSGTVGEWVKTPSLDNGFMIKATDETAAGPVGGPRYEAGEDVYGGETRNMPRLTVTYGQPGVVMDIPDTIHATGAELSWSAYQDPSSGTGDNLVEYQVHRSVSQTFTPSATTLVAPVAPGTTSFTDTTAVPTAADATGEGKLYYYQVAVKRKDGTIVPSSTQIVRLPKAGHTTKILVASGDTSLTSGQPTTPRDTVQDITTQYWDLVGNASPTYGDTRTVMEWDAAAWDIPAGAVVTDSKLQMWQETTETTELDGNGDMVYPTQGVYNLHRATVDFNETTATWNDPDGSGTGTWNAGGTYSSTVQSAVSSVGEGPSRLSWDAKAVTQAFVDNPTWHKSLLVKMADEAASQDRSLFASGEAEDHNGLERSGPRLAVTYLSTAPEDTFYAPDTPERMTPGTTYQVPVTVSNTTPTTWVKGSQALVASWTLPDGSVAPGSEPTTTALPEDLSSGEVAEMTASVVAPPVSDGNLRSDYSLSWEIANTASAAQAKTARQEAEAAGEDSVDAAASAQGLDTTATGGAAEQTEAGVLAEAGIAALPTGQLKQNVAVEDPTSDQLGLESFYTYAGKNTGAGSTLMNNVAAGNAVWSYDAFANPGRGLSTFARFAYNSQDTSDTVSGFGWSAQVSGPIRLGAPLEFHPNNSPREVMLPDGDGTTHVFRLNTTTGQWDAPAGVNYRLTQKAGVDCRASNKDPDPDAWTMLRPDGTKFVFGCDGYLNQVIDKNGNTQQFTYAERQSNNQPRKFLQYVTDPTGRQTLTVNYWTKGQTGWQYVDEATGNLVNGSGALNNSKIYDHVRSMTDISGRKIEFYYTGKGLMGRMIDGVGATDASGASIAKTFKFTYDADQGNKNAKLARITDPRGNDTELSYFYPSEGDDPKDHWSVQTITDRNDGVTTFDYAPNATAGWWNSTVTDAEDHATTYVSDDFGRPRSVTNAKSETVSLTWDTDNNVRTLTEDNGAVTAYCYDPKSGYPLWQRDAEQNADRGGAPPASECVPGETAEQAPPGTQVMEYRTWDSGYVAQIAKTTSPQGRKNQFTYDAKGNLLTVTDGKGIATATAGDYTTSYTYDTYGQLLTATDANENVTEYREYTDVGYPVVTEDALGNVSRTTYSNDGRGLVTQVEDPLDGLVTQAYDAFGRPLAATDRKSAGETITTPAPVYDANDNVTTATAPNGSTSTATYDKADQVTSASAPKDTTAGPDRISKYEYDTVGNVLKTIEPKGVATTGDATDYVTSYAYDTIYQLTAVTNAEGDRIEYDYDEVGNTVEVRDPIKVASADAEDYTSKTEYDLNHRPVAAVDAEGNRSTTDYDADGLTVSSTDAFGNTSYVTYDERGAAVESKAPHSGSGESTVYRTTKVEYDEVGNQTRVITPRGVATANTEDFAARTQYDELNRPVRSYQPYDPADSRYNDPNVYTETTYDAAGRVVATSLPPSEGQTVRNSTEVEYFDNGWVKQSVDPHGITTSYDYNELGQQTARTLTAADGSTSRTMAWSYFPDGKQASMSDEGAPVGSNVTLVDNTDAQSTSATGTWATASVEGEQGFNHRTHAAGTGTDAFTWNLDVPADGTYDLYVTYPQVTSAATGAKYQLTHDPDGAEGTQPEVVEPAVTVNQATGAGAWRKVASYALSANELASVKLAVSSTGTVVADGVKLVRDNSADTDTEQKTFTYDYDVNGNLTGIADDSAGASVSSYEMVYDELNQVASVTENATAAVVTAYGYNPNGQPVTVDHPDQAAEYGYDLRNLVKTVTVTDTAGASAGDPTTTSYTYDERGAQVTQTKGNGNVVTNAYFNDGALKTVREETSGGALVASHEYTYNENGSQATDAASKRNADTDALMDSTTSYTYDPVDRLIEKTKTGSGASTETYVHDDNANVVNQTVGGTTTTYSYDRNRLQTVTTPGQTASYTYDPFGRQASVTAAGSVVSRNTYDGFDHVVKSEEIDDAGLLKATTYAFDPLDRTTSKTSDGKTTRFTYLGLSSEVLTEDVAGQLAKSYQYSPWGQRLSQVTHPGAPDESDGDGAPEVGTAFYGYNAHTDVETLTDEAGGTVATYGYTAYGDADRSETTGIDKPDPVSPDAEPFNAYRYNSKRFDTASGTYDMGFRDYDPGLNRFTSRDMYNGALADLGLGSDPYTSNRYAFTAGNPISLIEGDGHAPCSACGSGGSWGGGGVGTLARPAPLAPLAAPGTAGGTGSTLSSALGGTVGILAVLGFEAVGSSGVLAAPESDPKPSPSTPSKTGAGATCSNTPSYLDLDSLKRAQGASICIPGNQRTPNKIRAKPSPGSKWARGYIKPLGGERGNINSCHLLAGSLGGDGRNPRNVATCARGLNTKEIDSDQNDINMYHALEKQVGWLVDNGWTVNYMVRVNYIGDRTVPTSFQANFVATKAGLGTKTVIASFQNTYKGTNLGNATDANGDAVPLIGEP
ncbi:RHS repeat-associated protein [Promicromonospora sp. AC04]|uniref:golvesin C-terminal-like domain-containing protein n=1 Tax=Promicromonospora sp. AC04 TaxID=2135723 RepID=UPI000D471B20|nr:DNRLRE domain-containing protein [Promicromonospora sp. AC04]PUB27631.1 RHS repeat-associated protein [Promicromonospora sp. AC04]